MTTEIIDTDNELSPSTTPTPTEAPTLNDFLPPKPSEPIDIPKKVKKPRKPMTAEHKEKLLSALVKAREQSKIKRGKTAQAKKILKEEKNRETDNIIRKSLMAKDKPDARDDEIDNLKKKLKEMTLQDVLPKEPMKRKVEKVVVEKKVMDDIPEEPPQIKYTNLRGKKNKRK